MIEFKKLGSLVLALGLTCLAAGHLRAADEVKGPRIAFEEKEFVFPAAVVGTLVTHAFKFKNVGTEELIIRKVDTSCGCTVSKIPNDRIKPGEEGTVELTLDTSEKIGAATLVRGTVYSNDSRETAIGPCTSILELKGEVVTCYRLMPTGAYYGQFVRPNGAKTVEMRAPGVLDAAEGYKILGIEVPGSWIKVETRALEPTELPKGSKGGYAFKVTVLPSVPLGDFHQLVVVKTDVARQPSFRFPVVGIAMGAVKGPEALLLGRFRRGENVERVAPLERMDGTAGGVSILSLDYDKTRLEVTTEVVIAGIRTDLRIKIRKDAPPGAFSTDLVVRLNEPRSPVVRIPVFGDILPRVSPDPIVCILRPGDDTATLAVPIEGGKLLGATIAPLAVGSLEATVEPAADPKPATVTVRGKGLVAGSSTVLVLTTDVAGEEQVRVPVVITAAP